jgi:MFS family permease
MSSFDEIRVKEGCFLKLKRFFSVTIKDTNFLKGVSSVLGASLINMIAGAIFAVCQLFIYEISYIKNTGHDISNDHEMFYYPIIKFFQHVFSIVSGMIYKKIGLHYTNLIGIIFLFIGYLILYLSSSLAVDITSMVILGIGTGIINYPSTANACEYFVNNNGIVIGIIETMMSVGSFVFNLLAEKIIDSKKDEYESENEYKKTIDEETFYILEIAEKFKFFLLILILISAVLYGISFALIFKKKEDKFKDSKNAQIGLLQADDNTDHFGGQSFDSKQLELIDNNDEEQKPKDFKKIFIKALKTKALIMITLIAILETPLTSMIFSIYRDIGLNNKIKESFASYIGPYSFVCECVGEFIFGLLCDYSLKKYLLLIILGIDAIIAFFYCFTFDSSLLFSIATNLASFTSGGFYSVKDFYLINIFGVFIYVELIGFVNLCSAIIFIVILTPISYYLKKNLPEGGLWILFISFGVCDVIGFILGLFIKDDKFDCDKAMGDEEDKIVGGQDENM